MEPDLSDLYLQSHRINGMIYWLRTSIPIKIENFRNLKGHLKIDTVEPKNPDVLIPPVFIGEDGKIKRRTLISDVILVDNDASIFGLISLDRPEELEYRDKSVLIMRTMFVPFIITNYPERGRYFLILICKRKTSRELAKSINGFIGEFGLSIDNCTINQDNIVAIREELHGELLDITLADFPNPKISSKRIWGEGFQEEPEYLVDAEISTVKQHQFRFTWRIGSDRDGLVGVSEDALIRFWTNLTFQEYLTFLKTHVIPRLSYPSKYLLPDMDLRAFDENNIIKRKSL